MNQPKAESYLPMWKDLGLDIEAHNQLLETLGKYYQDIYLTQNNRPEGMKYFDFVMSEMHGLRVKELIDKKKKGQRVIGTYCTFVPEEMILAVGGTCVGLCAGAEIGFSKAEQYLPRNTCSLIKAIFGFTLSGVCPYVEACDVLIGETTCDGKKKAYEIFKDIKNLYVMEIPQFKNEIDRTLWLSELKRLKNFLEESSGVKMDVENLKKSIAVVNEKRKAVLRIMDLRKHEPPPISGKDALLINQIAFYDDPVRFAENVNKIADELEERVEKGIGVTSKKSPRILISGCPIPIPNWKLPHLVESSGAVIVGEDSCVGMRNIRNLVKTDGDTVDKLLENILDRYIQIDCACFSPNNERMEHIVQMSKDLKADGVIHYAIQFCTPYLVESYRVVKALVKEGIPLLKIETDYSMEDAGQLSTRIQAFLEMLG